MKDSHLPLLLMMLSSLTTTLLLFLSISTIGGSYAYSNSLLYHSSSSLIQSPRSLVARNTHHNQRLSSLLSSPISYYTTSSSSSSSASSASTSSLYAVHPQQPDTDVAFGSTTGAGLGLGNDDDDDEEQEYEKMRQTRQDAVDKLFREQDELLKAERKKKAWGDYANATTKEEIRKVGKTLQSKIAKENQLKAKFAESVGVQMEILEPEDDFVDDTENGNFKNVLKAAANGNRGKWFDKVDKQLEAEWQELENGNEVDGDGVGVDTNGSNTDNKKLIDKSTVSINGKIVSRDTLQGVRVGSAGGWSLEIFPGDFVVHRKYGIGRFEKTCLRPKKLTPEEKKAQEKRRAQIMRKVLKSIKGGATPEDIEKVKNTFGTERDRDPISNPQTTVLEITYADGIVHVPVERAYRLSRYRAGDTAIKPKLSKVHGDAWRRAKARVEESTVQMAQDVLALYATRETLQRRPFDPSKEHLIKEFETTFPFEPTPDQKKCFEDVENDMVWRSRPMDRLVCGDVGFGKTEVALRALFRAVTNGRQGALLAPTGVLAAQHFKNVMKRMGEDSKFGKRVALLRGGTSKNSKAGKQLRQDIVEGKYDIIVGTHSLLSKDMAFKDLGLLVIDEEQRFGVKQKERLKVICDGIDVLTLSATPIPRTLQMSLSGIRDTSTIRSPPPMRKPTITYVQEFTEEVVRYAITNELNRGGQCYYVVPRISMLGKAQATITKIFPSIRVVQAHGRMPKNGAEENVAAFAEGHYDVLLATTVIENGVDIPSVNTIIIHNAQNFGMSTLYQLRGRVGRSDKQAYAYFLHREESITEQAAMRLQAIGELNELGSGFDVANRDLEIRGAGSLLGTEQSGMAAKVGFDLYMRMLKKSIRQLRGLDLPLVPRTNILLPRRQGAIEKTIKTEAGKSIQVNAFEIPESYIPDPIVRAMEETSARLAESSAKLIDLTNEWKEKYGVMPASLQTKIKTLHLHACTRRLGIDLVGLMDSGFENENGEPRYDCILRSPGLRPRHWATIVPLLPRGISTRGLDVVFPARFTVNGSIDLELTGGERFDLKSLLEDPSLGDNNNDNDNWDALDEEDVEAMKEISSAYAVTNFENDVDIEQYPRFVIKDFGKGPNAVDRLLKFLLPAAKVVYEKQEADKNQAKVAAQLREKQLIMQKKNSRAEKLAEARYLLPEHKERIMKELEETEE